MATIATAKDQVNQYLHKLTVSIVSQDVQANTTKVRYVYTVTRSGTAANGSWTTLNNVTFHAVVNGVDHTAAPNFDFRSQTVLTVMDSTQTITHGADGLKPINIRLHSNALAGSIWFFAADSGNVSMNLTPISRASDFTMTPPTVIEGGSTTIDIDATDDDYRHTVEWESDGSSGTIGTNIASTVGYTPDTDLLDGWPQVSITITVTTFDGATQIGDPVEHDLLFRTAPAYPEVGLGTPYDMRIRRLALVSGKLVPKESVPFITATTTDTLSASGSLTLDVPTSIYSTDLDEAVVIADFFDGSQWITGNLIFVLTRSEGDLTDLDGVVKYSGTSYVDFLLSKGVVTSEPSPATRTPGDFIRLYFDAGKNRGWGPLLSRSFSATATSSASKWKSTTEFDVNRDMPFSQILDGFVSDVLCEYRSHFDFTSGKAVLDMYNVGYGADWTVATADPVVNLATAGLWKVADKAPVRKDASDKITRVYVRGEGKYGVTRESSSIVNPIFGHLEGSLDAAGVKKTVKLNQLGDATLKQNKSSVVERTFSYDLSSTQTPTHIYPYRTFRVGDWILVPSDNGPERVRVSQIAITRDEDSTVATITVGDLIPSGIYATVRKQAQLGGGAISGGTLGGTPAILSSLIPNGPLALNAVADGYWDATGAPKAGVVVTWQEVDTSLEGNSLEVDAYEVYTRAELGDPWVLAAVTDITTVTLAPLDINASFDIEVRARTAAGIFGEWSDVFSITTPAPTETLAAPSAPTLESNALGTVTIHWNGLIGGGTPPLWFNYAIAEISDTMGGAYTQAGGQLTSTGDITVDNIGAGTWWFRIVGYDTLNVRGAASTAVSIVVTVDLGDLREPEQVTGLSATSLGYWNGAHAESSITAEWDAVTLATDTTAIDIRVYELWGRLDSSMDWALLGSTDQTTVTVQPVTPMGGVWHLKVRAVGANLVQGAFSSEYDVTALAPAMNMLPPTTPGLETARGVLIVDWDGQVIDDEGSDDDDGGVVFPAPSYLASVDIQISVDDGTTWSSVGFLASGDYSQNIAGLGVGTEVWVRLVAYDVLGQASDPSNVAIITIVGINGPDIIAGTVTANEIAAGTITVDLVNSSFGNDLDISSNGTVSIISGQAATAQAAAIAAGDAAAAIRTRYDFTPTEAVISQPGSAFQVAISNTQLEFRESGVARAYLNAGVFNAPRMATTQIVLTYHVIQDDPDGTVIRRL